MFNFIMENLANILISVGLLAVIASIIAKIRRDKKKGNPIGCGCGCKGCPSSSFCHMQTSASAPTKKAKI